MRSEARSSTTKRNAYSPSAGGTREPDHAAQKLSEGKSFSGAPPPQEKSMFGSMRKRGSPLKPRAGK